MVWARAMVLGVMLYGLGIATCGVQSVFAAASRGVARPLVATQTSATKIALRACVIARRVNVLSLFFGLAAVPTLTRRRGARAARSVAPERAV